MTFLLTILHKLARISYNFHTKLEIHKVVFLVLLCIFLSKNLYSYAKNTEEFKNGIKFLIKMRKYQFLIPACRHQTQIRAKSDQLYNGFGDVMPVVIYSRYVKVTSIFEFSPLKLPCMQIFMCLAFIFQPVFGFGDDMPGSKTGTSAIFLSRI